MTGSQDGVERALGLQSMKLAHLPMGRRRGEQKREREQAGSADSKRSIGHVAISMVIQCKKV